MAGRRCITIFFTHTHTHTGNGIQHMIWFCFVVSFPLPRSLLETSSLFSLRLSDLQGGATGFVCSGSTFWTWAREAWESNREGDKRSGCFGHIKVAVYWYSNVSFSTFFSFFLDWEGLLFFLFLGFVTRHDRQRTFLYY